MGGFLLAVTNDYDVFFVSESVEQYLGFNQVSRPESLQQKVCRLNCCHTSYAVVRSRYCFAVVCSCVSQSVCL